VVESDGKGGNRVQTAGVSVAYPAEYRVLKTNSSLLNEVAKITGGKQLSKPEEVHRKVTIPGESLTEIWPTLLLLALIVLPLDIANRRISVPFWKLFERKPKQRESADVARLKTLKNVKSATRSVEPLATTPTQARTVAPIAKAEPPAETTIVTEETANPDSAGSALLEAKRKRNRSE
jgi:hypothetical protein